MKALVTMLFSLALVLSHWPATAGQVRQLCQSEEACGCGNSACCMEEAPGSDSAPLSQAPAADQSRAQILAAVQALGQLLLPVRTAAVVTSLPPVPPASAAVPLFQRDCSYLI